MKNIEGIKIIPTETLPDEVELVGQPRVLSLSIEEINKLKQINEMESMLGNTESIEENHEKTM